MHSVLIRSLIVAGLAAAGLAADAQVLAPPPIAATDDPRAAGFAPWLESFRARLRATGVSEGTLAAALDGLDFSLRVVELDRAQPGDSGGAPARFDSYLARRLDAVRIAGGRRMQQQAGPQLAAAEARFGVPGAIVLGIWGMESSYGAVTGDFDVPRALATLAYDGRRAALFTRELEAAVRIVDKGLASRGQLRGSWAGAMGQPQFLPSSYLSYAADGDGDGRIDIWSNEADVAASIGSYLAKHGWQRGEPWGFRVELPAGFDRERVRNPVRPTSCVRPLEKHSRWIPVREWRSLGLVPAPGRSWPADDALATLVEPDGPGAPAYLTFRNYRALLEYNCSNFYALSVALLADELAS